MCVSPDIQPICCDECGTTETVTRPRPAMANHAIYRLLFWEIEVGPLCKKKCVAMLLKLSYLMFGSWCRSVA